METDFLTTGALAAEAGVNLETVRFYERSGLLKKPRRTAAGYRQYPSADVVRLRFIKRAQELGFSLKEIAELLSLRAAPARNRSRVKRLAVDKLTVIEGKIRDLMRMRDTLASVSSACDGRGSVVDCPIITALENDQ
ncbi:MAG TPA: MerR family DNA-binding protein [Chthoniobacterales bacterium]|jgi:Hg(II)-responsive transcriptional regulator